MVGRDLVMPRLRQTWHLAGESCRHVTCTQKQLHISASAASPSPFVMHPLSVMQPLSLEPAGAAWCTGAGHGLMSVLLAHVFVGGARLGFLLFIGLARCHRGLQGLVLQQVCLREAELGGDDFSLSHLERCTVWLTGQLRALRMRELQGCTIVAAGVTGATFIEGACAPALLCWLSMLLLS